MNTNRPIRVLVIDDHRMFRDALHLLVEKDSDIELAGESGDGLEGLAMAVRVRPDVILLDIEMSGISGIQTAHRLRKVAPAAKVLMLSGYHDQEYVLEALGKARAAGYLLKSDAGSELLGAIRAVAAGKRYISPDVAPIVLDTLRRDGPSDVDGEGALTKREREILRLIAQGTSSKAIAQSLGISPKTVQAHRSNLAVKLRLPSTAAIVRWAIKHKLMKLD